MRLGSDGGRDRVLRPIVLAAEERQRKVGLELHEGLSQQLAGLALLAGALATRLERVRSEESAAAIEIANELGSAVEAARELAVGLYPVDAVHGGAHAALDHVAERACRSRGVDWEMHHEGAEPELEENERIQLCRILEETIDQAVKERGAAWVRVELRVGNWGVVLSVTDDGRKPLGMGGRSRRLLNGRAQLYGAQMRVRKCLGGGQQVSFRWAE